MPTQDYSLDNATSILDLWDWEPNCATPGISVGTSPNRIKFASKLAKYVCLFNESGFKQLDEIVERRPYTWTSNWVCGASIATAQSAIFLGFVTEYSETNGDVRIFYGMVFFYYSGSYWGKPTIRLIDTSGAVSEKFGGSYYAVTGFGADNAVMKNISVNVTFFRVTVGGVFKVNCRISCAIDGVSFISNQPNDSLMYNTAMTEGLTPSIMLPNIGPDNDAIVGLMSLGWM